MESISEEGNQEQEPVKTQNGTGKVKFCTGLCTMPLSYFLCLFFFFWIINLCKPRVPFKNCYKNYDPLEK